MQEVVDELSVMKEIVILEMEVGTDKGMDRQTFIPCEIYIRLSLIFRVKSGVKRCYVREKSNKFWLKYNIGLAKNSFSFFFMMLWKNPNEFFDQPNIRTPRIDIHFELPWTTAWGVGQKGNQKNLLTRNGQRNSKTNDVIYLLLHYGHKYKSERCGKRGKSQEPQWRRSC